MTTYRQGIPILSLKSPSCERYLKWLVEDDPFDSVPLAKQLDDRRYSFFVAEEVFKVFTNKRFQGMKKEDRDYLCLFLPLQFVPNEQVENWVRNNNISDVAFYNNGKERVSVNVFHSIKETFVYTKNGKYCTYSKYDNNTLIKKEESMKTRCGKYITIYKLLVDSKYTVEEWYKGDGRMYLRKKKVGSKTCTTTYSKRLIRETICYQGNSENYEERKYNVDSRRYQLIRKTWKSLRTLDEVHSSYFEHEEEEVLKSVVHYRCGIKHGECVTYTNPSSKENLVGVLVENYRYDLRHGEVKEWDEKGRLIVKRYDNDKLIQEQWTFPLHFLPHLFFLLALITVISTI